MTVVVGLIITAVTLPVDMETVQVEPGSLPDLLEAFAKTLEGKINST